MRRLVVIGLCLVAASAISAVASATASAAAPEYGQCIKKAKAEGAGYSDGSCTTAVGSEAKYEWSTDLGSKTKFTVKQKYDWTDKYTYCLAERGEEQVAKDDREKAEQYEKQSEIEKAIQFYRRANEHQRHAEELLKDAALKEKDGETCEKVIEKEVTTPVKLETTSGAKVECGTLSGSGEYSGKKTVANITMTFTECSLEASYCASTGANAGEVHTTTLDGELGTIKTEKEAVDNEVGLALWPASGTVVAEFACGVTSVVVTGSVIRELDTNAMLKDQAVTYKQSNGKQEFERFEDGPPDFLKALITGSTEQATGLALTGTQTNEEDIEVNTVV